MAHSLRSRARASLFAAVLLAACQELPHHPGMKVQILEQGGLEALNPSDVAVPPIEFSLEGVVAPEMLLRTVVQKALIKRQYSALSLEFVDSRVIDASAGYGALGADAVCQIVVHDWNERLWETGRLISFDVELRLMDPRDDSGRPLWAARYPGRVDATSEVSHLPEGALYEYAVEQVALELAGAIPRRKTEPGRD